MLLGIRLPQNFNRPYSAENIADFWRRWHITLSNWLRDYVYFSLPGLRSKWKVFTYANLIITMAIGGLWHGPTMTFLVWGLLHGTALAALRSSPKAWAMPAWLRVLATFHFVAFAWIFFRAANLGIARDILLQIGSCTVSLANVTPSFMLILSIAAMAHFVPRNWYDGGLRLFTVSPAYIQAAALALLVIAIQYIAATGTAPFIYTKF